MAYNGRKRRRGRGYSGVLIFLFAACIMLILSTTLLFNVENVNVTGASNYTAQEIIDASGIKAGDNLVRMTSERMADKIEEKLVYIENAEITRSFPDTLVINVEASVPAANFICDKYILLISRSGKVLEQITEPKAGLLNFMGTDPKGGLLPGSEFESEDEHKTAVINELMEYYAKSDNAAEGVTMIDVTDRSNISYTYDGRIVVKLGTINDIDYKMDFSREIVTKQIGERTEGVLTVLSDAQRASFLDKDSLEHNARVYNENMAALEAAQAAENADQTETVTQTSATETTKIDPIME
ncbi:MAG: FtsQ-type POTRA domain-containing protein [Oscillospiraceae bacterium]|nr:FtsQ-type POTRA domain-containing protein [Oscillospiraceae bacterium]